jgi:hypothetical protein
MGRINDDGTRLKTFLPCESLSLRRRPVATKVSGRWFFLRLCQRVFIRAVHEIAARRLVGPRRLEDPATRSPGLAESHGALERF